MSSEKASSLRPFLYFVLAIATVIGIAVFLGRKKVASTAAPPAEMTVEVETVAAVPPRKAGDVRAKSIDISRCARKDAKVVGNRIVFGPCLRVVYGKE